MSGRLQEPVMQQSPRSEGEGRRSSRSQGPSAGLGQDTLLPHSQGRSLARPWTLGLGYRGQRVQDEASLPLPFSCGQEPSEQSPGEMHRSRFHREKHKESKKEREEIQRLPLSRPILFSDTLDTATTNNCYLNATSILPQTWNFVHIFPLASQTNPRRSVLCPFHDPAD